MKITKIPGLGRFGHFIDDIDLNTISEEEWFNVGQLHLKGLVTIIRGNNMDHHRYNELIEKWGGSRFNRPIYFYQKYGKPLKQLLLNRELDEADALVINSGRRWQVDKRYIGMIRVTPKKNDRGQTLGIFGDGELLWHSNEPGDPAFTPGVSLMGWENMIGSCTGFCTTVDWYEEQTESFRSELDELVMVHNYDNYVMGNSFVPEQDDFMKKASCPEDNSKIPLVIKSPGGLKGLHFSCTSDYFDGMSKEESKRLIDIIKKGIFQEKYIYKHWYKHDRDLLIFDNSITLHNREIENDGHIPNRVAYRVQFDYDNLTGGVYLPFYQDEFNQKKLVRLDLLKKAMEGMDKAYGKR
jgi:hypothetical protein